MRTIIFLPLVFGLCIRGFAEDRVAHPDVARTLPQALKYLVETGDDWIADRNCASCHHLQMMIWSLREALYLKKPSLVP